MARVVRFHRTGGPDVMQFDDLPVGDPQRGELRVRIEAIGLNRAEAMFRSGAYLETPRLPARLGYEASATVEAVGEGVDGFAPGDAVSVIPAFSMNDYGVYADTAIVPAYSVVQRPAGVSVIESAAVWMAYLTAWGALVDIGRLGRGDAVIIPAASSSVGLAAIQMANCVGAIPIATTRTRAKAAALQEAGAAHVVVTSERDLVAEVAHVTGGKGARLAFDPVGGPQVETLAQAMSRDGVIVVYGALATAPTPFPVIAAMQKALSCAATPCSNSSATGSGWPAPRPSSKMGSPAEASSRSSRRHSRSTRSFRLTSTWSRTSSSGRSSSQSRTDAALLSSA